MGLFSKKASAATTVSGQTSANTAVKTGLASAGRATVNTGKGVVKSAWKLITFPLKIVKKVKTPLMIVGGAVAVHGAIKAFFKQGRLEAKSLGVNPEVVQVNPNSSSSLEERLDEYKRTLGNENAGDEKLNDLYDGKQTKETPVSSVDDTSITQSDATSTNDQPSTTEPVNQNTSVNRQLEYEDEDEDEGEYEDEDSLEGDFD